MFLIYILTNSAREFPFLYILAHSSVGKECTCNAGDLDSIGKDWVGKIPWRRERLSTPVFWPGEFHGLYRPWDHKESACNAGHLGDLGWEDPLEKGKAIHSSILAWRIPRTV